MKIVRLSLQRDHDVLRVTQTSDTAVRNIAKAGFIYACQMLATLNYNGCSTLRRHAILTACFLHPSSKAILSLQRLYQDDTSPNICTSEMTTDLGIESECKGNFINLAPIISLLASVRPRHLDQDLSWKDLRSLYLTEWGSPGSNDRTTSSTGSKRKHSHLLQDMLVEKTDTQKASKKTNLLIDHIYTSRFLPESQIKSSIQAASSSCNLKSYAIHHCDTQQTLGNGTAATPLPCTDNILNMSPTLDKTNANVSTAQSQNAAAVNASYAPEWFEQNSMEQSASSKWLSAVHVSEEDQDISDLMNQLSTYLPKSLGNDTDFPDAKQTTDNTVQTHNSRPTTLFSKNQFLSNPELGLHATNATPLRAAMTRQYSLKPISGPVPYNRVPDVAVHGKTYSPQPLQRTRKITRPLIRKQPVEPAKLRRYSLRQLKTQ